LFPKLPTQPGYWKRRQRLSNTIEWLIGIFAADSPGYRDTVVRIDSTLVECGRSADTTRRSQLADACGYPYSRSHSRWFWGMRLHSWPRRREPRSSPRRIKKTAKSRSGCSQSACTAAR
jgi:hypothetical protein